MTTSDGKRPDHSRHILPSGQLLIYRLLGILVLLVGIGMVWYGVTEPYWTFVLVGVISILAGAWVVFASRTLRR